MRTKPTGGRPAKYGWMILFLVNIVVVLYGVSFVVSGAESDGQLFANTVGMTWNQFIATNQGIVLYVNDTLRLLGVALIGVGIYGSVLARTAYREAKRWAWYALLYGPLGYLWALALTYARGGGQWPVFAVLLVANLAGLLIPVRSFFSRDLVE